MLDCVGLLALSNHALICCFLVHSVINDDIDDLNDMDSSEKQSNHDYTMLDSNSKDNEMSE